MKANGSGRPSLLKHFLESALELVYLTIQNLQIKWETTTYNWKEIINQFSIIFEERIRLHRFD